MSTVTAAKSSAPQHAPKSTRRAVSARIPPLKDGDRLTSDEFMRRYEAMPHIKKAELIGGIVYMGSPVRADLHGRPDGLVHYWLGDYAFLTKTCEMLPNTTLKLNVENVPQPDALLRLLPEHGGKSRIDEKDYLVGPVELVVEITASTSKADARKRDEAYQACGVIEYIGWRTEEKAINWCALENGRYVELLPDADGLIHSRVFPGLCLDVKAILAGDMDRVIEVLRDAVRSAKPS